LCGRACEWGSFVAALRGDSAQGQLREVELKRELEALRKEKAELKKQLDDALLLLNQTKSAMQVSCVCERAGTRVSERE